MVDYLMTPFDVGGVSPCRGAGTWYGQMQASVTDSWTNIDIDLDGSSDLGMFFLLEHLCLWFNDEAEATLEAVAYVTAPFGPEGTALTLGTVHVGNRVTTPAEALGVMRNPVLLIPRKVTVPLVRARCRLSASGTETILMLAWGRFFRRGELRDGREVPHW